MTTKLLEPVGRYVVMSRPVAGRRPIASGDVLFCSGINLQNGVPAYYLRRSGASQCAKVQRESFDVLPEDYKS